MKHLLLLMAMAALCVADGKAQQRDTLTTSDSLATASTNDSLMSVLVRPALISENRAQQAGPKTDAWGARKNGALAVGEILLVNGLVWAYNEYPRGANFTQINPRSWVDNFQHGWDYDDNHFANNMFAHPFHGSLYYNAPRSNGFNFWASVPFAFMGSGFWECCGETHRPAINDWLATSVGGIAIGEALYRITSTVLDNTATGSERVWREIGGAVLNPVRGFSRLVTGRATKVYPNPENPLDRVPDRLFNTLHLGARRVVDQGPLEEEDNTTGFLLVDFQYGSPFAASRRKPFDFFRFQFQLNSRDKEAVGGLGIRGNLWATDLKRSEKNQLMFGAALNFDYFNNNAVEFGGQSVGAFLLSRWPLSTKVALASELSAEAQILGAVNSEFAFIVMTPGQERLREYDFGVGGGGRGGLSLLLNGRTLLQATYRILYLNTLNGAKGTLPTIGEIDTWHLLQALLVRVRVPIIKHFGVGADFTWYKRNSHMQNPNLQDITQRVRVVRLYATWEVGRGVGF